MTISQFSRPVSKFTLSKSLLTNWAYFRQRINESWPVRAEPGEVVTSIAIFIKVACMTNSKQLEMILPQAYHKIYPDGVYTSVPWAIIGSMIFSFHLVSMYYERRISRIVMQGICTVFLLDYALHAIRNFPPAPGGWDNLLFFLISVVTFEILLRKKHWNKE